jgi:hypothetical protein
VENEEIRRPITLFPRDTSLFKGSVVALTQTTIFHHTALTSSSLLIDEKQGQHEKHISTHVLWHIFQAHNSVGMTNDGSLQP